MFPWWILLPICLSTSMIVGFTCRRLKFPDYGSITIGLTAALVVGYYLR